MLKKIIIVIVPLIIVIVILLRRTPDIERISGGIIIQATIGDASYLNPVLATDSASGYINSLVFNGLLKYDKDLNLVGELAKSWEVSEDKLKITFHLKKGIKWHNGEEFTSDDVQYTYNILMDPKTQTPYSSRFDRVKNLTTPDPYTVVVEYSEVFSPALESWGMGILPAHLYRNTDINTNPINRTPIGTGPYKFVSWRTDDRIILHANSEYFEGNVKIKKVIYKIVPDLSVQFMEIQRGTIDWMSPTPDQWIKETLKKEFLNDFNRYRYPSFSYTYLGYNLKNELFKDIRVRRAISYGIDKEQLVESVLQGLGTEATGPYPPNSWAYNPDVKDHGYNPKKAIKLLNESGWKKNPLSGILEKDGRKFSFTLMTNQGNVMRKMTAEIIQSQLKKIGMDVSVRIQEWSSFIHQYIDKRQFDAIILGWSLSVDPDQYSIWHSSQRGEDQYNFVSYVNSEVDRLLEEGRTVFDMEKRKKIYHQIHRILHDDQPYLFLYVPDSRHIIQKRFKNITVEKAGIGYNFIDWYVPENLRKYEK